MYMMIMVTNFSDFLQMGQFSHSVRVLFTACYDLISLVCHLKFGPVF